MESPRSWFELRALGTYVQVQTGADPDDARRRTEEILAAVDLACSRFRPDSDLSRANAAPGRWTRVSPLFVAAVQVAITAAEQTDGLVDPCLGRTMVELGYDVDFAQLSRRPRAAGVATLLPCGDAWKQIGVDVDAVRVPADVALDLGATAKSWASDLVALSLYEEFAAPSLVSLGGDIRISGGEAGTPWPIEVTEYPAGIEESIAPASIWLTDGGLATSSTQVRRWRSGGVERHHLIDPRTGVPIAPYWRTVTATGPTCVAANVAATAALVLADDASAWLTARQVSARLVRDDGTIKLVGDWPEPVVEAGSACSRL